MRIEEKKVFIFEFPYEQTTLTIPVKAENRQDAGEKLQRFLSGIQTDLAMEFPKVMPKETNIPDQDGTPVIWPPASIIPPEVLELRINTLLTDLGAGELKGKARDETIKNWCGVPNTEANYTKIITELELIATGKKEINGKK